MNEEFGKLGKPRFKLQTIVSGVISVIIIFELGGIWNDLHHMRSEQVKNALYSIPTERRNSLRNTPIGKRLQNTVAVNGSVEVEGNVKLDEPVEVEVDR